MVTERQEKLLNFLIKEYITTAEPVSSELLKKSSALDISSATVRNDLQALTTEGFLKQPHTSSGRIPTEKAYQYVAEKICQKREKIFAEFIEKEIEKTRLRIEVEMKLAKELMDSLSEISTTLTISYKKGYEPEKDTLFEILSIMGPSKTTHNKNINLIESLIKELENF